MTKNTTKPLTNIDRTQELQAIGCLGFILCTLRELHKPVVGEAFRCGEVPLYGVYRLPSHSKITRNEKISSVMDFSILVDPSVCASKEEDNRQKGKVKIILPKIEGMEEAIQIVVQEGDRVRIQGKEVSEELEQMARRVAENSLSLVCRDLRPSV